MLVAELIKDASKPFGHGISLDKLALPIFPDVVKKNDRFACTKDYFSF
jgi:hypothetical protein